MKKPLELAQYFSREHSLFYARVWSDGNLNLLKEWVDESVKLMLCVGTPDHKLTVWYSREELQKFDTIIVSKLLNEEGYLDRVEAAYYKHWEVLLKYLEKKTSINTSKDLQNFFEAFKTWWAPMAVIFEVVDLYHLPQRFRDQALRAREATQEYSDVGDELYIESFKRMYPQYADLAYVFVPEDIFNDNLEEGAERARELSKGYGLLNDDLFALDQLENKLSEKNLTLEKQEVDKNTSEIKGMSASRGKVVGKVRIISYKNQVGELEEGEVLVTEMTSPEYLPAMKKAAAFVTNEGGMTCHAAIVARELVKPCIVGTQTATQIFKNGDMVEVDANQGIIKILK
jgi:phosphohistidine swiveling domain-containing protein